jgi:hypothetical protein
VFTEGLTKRRAYTKCSNFVQGTSLVLIVYIEVSILRGIIEAYEHKLYISAPEYPLVS